MMKIGNKLSFGVSAVVAGQKSSTVNAIPQLVANSTSGKFVITAPVSKALGIAVGENVMFLNNISSVESAIAQKVEDLVAWATEQGIDLDTREGADAAIKEFSQWYIAKGEKLYDAKGNPVMASVRFSKEDKAAYLEAHIADYMASDEVREVLAQRCAELGIEATDENMINQLSIDDVQVPQYHAMSGSKTATTGSATGVGCQLNFTDTAIWGALKADIDEPEKKNRVFKVLLDEVQTAPFHNGKETVNVSIYPIVFSEDTDPIQRATKD